MATSIWSSSGSRVVIDWSHAPGAATTRPASEAWCRPAARTAQTVWSGLAVGSVLLAALTGGADGSKAGVTGLVVVVGRGAVLVLLWLPPSRAWFRERSVGPARPRR